MAIVKLFGFDEVDGVDGTWSGDEPGDEGDSGGGIDDGGFEHEVGPHFRDDVGADFVGESRISLRDIEAEVTRTSGPGDFEFPELGGPRIPDRERLRETGEDEGRGAAAKVNVVPERGAPAPAPHGAAGGGLTLSVDYTPRGVFVGAMLGTGYTATASAGIRINDGRPSATGTLTSYYAGFGVITPVGFPLSLSATMSLSSDNGFGVDCVSSTTLALPVLTLTFNMREGQIDSVTVSLGLALQWALALGYGCGVAYQ